MSLLSYYSIDYGLIRIKKANSIVFECLCVIFLEEFLRIYYHFSRRLIKEQWLDWRSFVRVVYCVCMLCWGLTLGLNGTLSQF